MNYEKRISRMAYICPDCRKKSLLPIFTYPGEVISVICACGSEILFKLDDEKHEVLEWTKVTRDDVVEKWRALIDWLYTQ